MITDLPEYPAVVKNQFKCGHFEDEVAANLDEAIHLRESAKFFPCTACLVASMRKGNPCPQPQPAPSISATV